VVFKVRISLNMSFTKLAGKLVLVLHQPLKA
jgi:hypothetical protein